MSEYVKKPIVVEAQQWRKNQSHPKVIYPMPGMKPSSDIRCMECGQASGQHGWIETLEGGHRACPGDYIIRGVKGEFYPCKPDIFEMTYGELMKCEGCLGIVPKLYRGESWGDEDNSLCPECLVAELDRREKEATDES